jgi:division protein CdvB (Snf7/Vps24/ESCRT-III family)
MPEKPTKKWCGELGGLMLGRIMESVCPDLRSRFMQTLCRAAVLKSRLEQAYLRLQTVQKLEDITAVIASVARVIGSLPSVVAEQEMREKLPEIPVLQTVFGSGKDGG